MVCNQRRLAERTDCIFGHWKITNPRSNPISKWTVTRALFVFPHDQAQWVIAITDIVLCIRSVEWTWDVVVRVDKRVVSKKCQGQDCQWPFAWYQIEIPVPILIISVIGGSGSRWLSVLSLDQSSVHYSNWGWIFSLSTTTRRSAIQQWILIEQWTIRFPSFLVWEFEVSQSRW